MSSFGKITKVLCLLTFFIGLLEVTKAESLVVGLIPADCLCEEFVDGIPVFPSYEDVELNVFGTNLSEDLTVGLSKQKKCVNIVGDHLKLKIAPNSQGNLAVLSLTTPSSDEFVLKKVRFYICFKDTIDSSHWSYPGFGDNIAFYVYRPILIPVVSLFLVLFCFAISSLMSGLNIGLMSLDQNELMLLKNSGTKKEKKYAAKLIPVRRNGNYLLCSILITATLCNSIATVFIDNFVSDWLAVFLTTVVIVLLCEILPQSVCTYFPLNIGYYTIYITRACMIITAPVSYPLGTILNLILGKEIVATYTKERLKELLKMTELPSHEEKIISGTLDLSLKRVEEVMTMLDDIFKLPITAVMDFETIASILESGYSRIPIYVGDQSNIQYVLLTKDLALLDPDDKIPVKVLVQNSKYNCNYIPVGKPLDEVLIFFKESRGHMAFVVEKESTDSNEKSVVGLVTFEDIIEEIFQAEINDETDTFSDNRNKCKLTNPTENNYLQSYVKLSMSYPSEIHKLTAFNFLSDIDEFSSKYISPRTLLALLNLDVYCSAPGNKTPQDNIYIQGVPADYFVMILEGEMEMKVSNKNLKIDVGAFKYFGVESLKVDSTEIFTPDYSLQAIKKSLYLKVSQNLYNAAILATKFERTNELPKINPKSELYKNFRLLVGSESLNTNVIKN